MLLQQQCLRKRFSLEILPSLSWFYCQHICVGTTAWVFQGGWDEDTRLTQDDVISALIRAHTTKFTCYKLSRRIRSGCEPKRALLGFSFPVEE